jgi:hypothetical protein
MQSASYQEGASHPVGVRCQEAVAVVVIQEEVAVVVWDQ